MKTEQDYIEFVKLVKQLRRIQDDWRRYRVYGIRCSMIALEKKVDDMIEKLMSDEQGSANQ